MFGLGEGGLRCVVMSCNVFICYLVQIFAVIDRFCICCIPCRVNAVYGFDMLQQTVCFHFCIAAYMVNFENNVMPPLGIVQFIRMTPVGCTQTDCTLAGFSVLECDWLACLPFPQIRGELALLPETPC